MPDISFDEARSVAIAKNFYAGLSDSGLLDFYFFGHISVKVVLFLFIAK